MKRAIAFLLVLVLLGLAACAKEPRLVTLAQYMDMAEDMPETELLFCNLGSGVTFELEETETMEALWSGLLAVQLDASRTEKSMAVDDGDIGFIFCGADEIRFSFCTSEYFWDGEQYLAVASPAQVRKLCDIASNALDAQQEAPTGDSALPEDWNFSILDNGDEAPNVLVITGDGLDGESYIEGVYAVEKAEETETGWRLTCRVGDFYSHDRLAVFELALADGRLDITRTDEGE